VSRFYALPKKQLRIEKERAAYGAAARQGSLLDRELDAYEPAPYQFRIAFEDGDGEHDYWCGDWETDATYFRRANFLGSDAALESMNETFNKQYPRAGLILAFGTMAKRQKQWILLGILRLDVSEQSELPL